MKKRVQKKPIKKYSFKKLTPPKKLDKRKSYFDLVGLAIIILLGILIYSNSFGCSFHFDDFPNIVDNTKIRNLTDMKAWWHFYPSRHVSIFSFVLNYHFFKLDVRYWHFVNLVIHLINTCLVWYLTLLIFSSPFMKNHEIARQKKVLAFFTALLFVSHPLATQSVTYIVQREASMVAMFYFLSIAFYMKARLSGNGNVSNYLLFTGSFISAILAMFTKENAFTLPFAIVLIEIFFLRTKKLKINFKDVRVLLFIATFLGIILILPLKFSFRIFNPIPPHLGNTYTVTPLNYLLTQFSVIVKYIQLLLLPINQNVDYDFPVSNNFFEIRILLSFLLLVSLIFLAIFLFNRNRIISFGISWFFLTLLIESSFIPIDDVIFEHRTYLPSFGYFLILSSGIYVLFRNRYKNLAISILAIITGSTSYLTYQRNKIWKDELTLWNDNVVKAPNKARPINNRGFAYRNLLQWNKALDDYSKSIEINPDYQVALSNRGIVYGHFGQWDKAIADYSRAIGIDPNYTLAYYNRGVAYGTLQQWDKAIADYSSAIGINPNYAIAYSNRGAAYEFLHQWNKAIIDYSKAIGIEPEFGNEHFNRGVSYANLGQWNKAITDYSEAINIDPGFKDAYVNRGVAYGNLGQWVKAIADFSKTIEIDPNYTIAYSNREIAYRKLQSKKL